MYQLKWLWKNLKGYHAIYILALFLSIFCNILQSVVPVFSQQIVDLFLTGDNAAENLETKPNLLVWLVIGMILATMFRALMSYLANTTYEYTSQKMLYSIRTDLFRKVLNQDMGFYDKFRTGDIMTRLTGDLDAIRHMASWIIRMVLECVTMILIGMVYFIYLDPLIAASLIVLGPVIFILTLSFRKRIAPKHRELRETMAQLNTAAQENISGNRVVKAFAREDYEITNFDEKNETFRVKHIDTALLWLKYFPYIETCANLCRLYFL